MNVVISGASRGIGKAVSLKLASQGHQIIAIARSKQDLIELEEKHSNIQTLAVDLLNPKLLAQKLNPILHKWGRVDALLNNAGHLINKPFMQTKAKDFINQYQSNVISAVELSQCCIPFMSANSHIVNISSMGGVQGSSKFPGLSAYSASKGAMSILTECMAEELKSKGIHVNALALGAVETDMLEKAFPGYKAPLKATQIANYICQYLISAYHYMNGQIVSVSLGSPS